ncbi:hypothetical protein TOPH_04290 [Tolypocladium ophioglossoides CBS 100239]|uniref:Uncharacterized protein n=1 Tax=Tolypocladium ophioglossoides (strain CBS 100239) TaxID=1163406 RepID=A0A0L0NA35_TOLOC|nr:hypothetical protein TOPH_04290 [Tolypocladium ophioglossoides CBS 100239]
MLDSSGPLCFGIPQQPSFARRRDVSSGSLACRQQVAPQLGQRLTVRAKAQHDFVSCGPWRRRATVRTQYLRHRSPGTRGRESSTLQLAGSGPFRLIQCDHRVAQHR